MEHQHILDPRKRQATPEEAKKQIHIRNLELEDLRAVMSSVEGRRFIWRFLSSTNLFQQSFTGNSETYFREGKRAIGLMLFRDLHESCHSLYLKMESEAVEPRKEA